MDWKEFQEETAKIFRDAGCAAEVEAKVEGVRGVHDIDVYVTFKNYGIDCSWVIECKNWNSNVPKEKVTALASIVSDVGADRGVIVSKIGFQSGAIRMAVKSNITLTTLDDLKEYLAEEIAQQECDFLDKQVLHMKRELFKLGKSETTKRDGFEVMTLTYPPGVDVKRHNELVGELSVLGVGLEQWKLGDTNLPYKFNDDESRLEKTGSVEEFIDVVKRCVSDCSEFMASIENKVNADDA